jgi:uncharacterized protein
MIFRRVRWLIEQGAGIRQPSIALDYFLKNNPSSKKTISKKMIEMYTLLDDHDVYLSIKYWMHSEDPILSDLCRRFLNRSLFRTTFLSRKPGKSLMADLFHMTRELLDKQGLPSDEESASYYCQSDQSYSEAYKYENEGIWILDDQQRAIEFSKAADTKNIIALTKPVVKPYIVHLKEADIRL